MDKDILDKRCAAALMVINYRFRLYVVPPTLRVIADSIGVERGDSVRAVIRELMRRGDVVRVRPEGQRPAYVPAWAVRVIQEAK